jgi:hypothetical protein
MNEYHGILSGIAQKVYQRYLDREQKIEAKQTKDREKRKARFEQQQKRISQKKENTRLQRRRKRV